MKARPLTPEYGKRIYDWWGRHPHLYRFMAWLVFLGRERTLRRRAAELAGIGPGATVLDLACGSGANFAALEARIGDRGRLIGFDYSPGMLASAEALKARHGWDNIELVQGDAEKMELPAASLDAAVCTLALSTMRDHRAAIERVRDGLRPGGRFAVLDAKELEGAARILNPLIRPLFRLTTNWDPRKNLIASLRDCFGAVEVKRFNAGSMYIAVGRASVD
ncbi:MAG TPA: methyltransferase domain-containing protein [Solirubrobacterales bacterium]